MNKIKVLIPVIIVAIICTTILVIIVLSSKPTKQPKKERELQALAGSANTIFNDMLLVRQLDDNDILSERTKRNIENWQNKFRRASD